MLTSIGSRSRSFTRKSRASPTAPSCQGPARRRMLRYRVARDAYQFPEGFIWGTATAAHQIEGGNVNNDWWALRAHTGHGVRRVERGRLRQLAPLARGPRLRRRHGSRRRTGSRSSGAGSSPKKASGRLRAWTTTGGSSPDVTSGASCRSSRSTTSRIRDGSRRKAAGRRPNAPELFARFCARTASVTGRPHRPRVHDQRTEHRRSDGVPGRGLPAGRRRTSGAGGRSRRACAGRTSWRSRSFAQGRASTRSASRFR